MANGSLGHMKKPYYMSDLTKRCSGRLQALRFWLNMTELGPTVAATALCVASAALLGITDGLIGSAVIRRIAAALGHEPR